MNKKMILILCVLWLAALLCCACGQQTPAEETTAPPAELTAEEIAQKMLQALEQTPCGQSEMIMEMTVSIGIGEEVEEMSMTNTTALTTSQEPYANHTVATTEMAVAGQTMETVVESYMIAEAEEIISYVNSSGIWVKASTGQTVADMTASQLMVDTTNVAIDETVTQWQGKEAICLTTQLQGDAMQAMVDSMLQNLQSQTGTEEGAELIGAADYAALTCDSRIYLDKETYLPMAEEVTFNGMGQVLAPVYQDLGVTVDVTNCTATANYLSYEPQAPITLPDGAAESAELWTRLLTGEPDNGDGTFTIREGTVLVDIATPEGFTLEEKDYDHVYFTREDYRAVYYTMYYLSGTDTTGSEFTAMVDSNVSRYESGGGEVAREQMTIPTQTLEFNCDILGMTWGSGREDAELYAWTPLASDGSGIYYLLVEVADGYNDGMGNSKSADITAEEFVSYLNCASPNALTG